MADDFKTNIERLRAFGQNLSSGAQEAGAVGAGGLYSSLALPGSETAQALAETGPAQGAVVERLEGEYGWAGGETQSDAGGFQEHEDAHAAQFHEIRDRIDQQTGGLGANRTGA